MKRILLAITIGFALAACDVYVVEPRYDPRNVILGQYDVSEYSETYQEMVYYTFQVTKSGQSEKIYISNFYGADISVYGFLDYDQITIPFQVVNGYEIEGVGNVFDGQISLSYRVYDQISKTRPDYCKTDAYLY